MINIDTKEDRVKISISGGGIITNINSNGGLDIEVDLDTFLKLQEAIGVNITPDNTVANYLISVINNLQNVVTTKLDKIEHNMKESFNYVEDILEDILDDIPTSKRVLLG